MLDTRHQGAEYDDPVFADKGMIGTLENRAAILVGPFLTSAGTLPVSQVLWISPDRSLVAMHSVYISHSEDSTEVSLCDGSYFDGAWQRPEHYEMPVYREWTRRRTAYRRRVLAEIDAGRIFNARRDGSGLDRGLKGIFYDDEKAHRIYDTLTERVWEAYGVG